ncbi:sugar phosphate isomerase/epimerase family protein [Saccharicrinis sp. GN24d3]|uniref:sugar phosphate isomerase/epimerase family protein n=1 Tax=Saccharicrinis sp. GN24d3 TaxID=3458416 RepID=UPI004035DB18
MAIIAPWIPSPINALNLKRADGPLKVNIFSKHLQFLNVRDAGQIAAELGFDGLDLTVRPKGHILPENVKSDLPAAIRDIQHSGSTCEMITTAITDVNNANDLEIIKVAANHGVRFYRSNWFKYHKEKPMQDSIRIYRQKIRELGEANKKYDIIGCYQNHAGTSIGSSYWEIKQLLETVDPIYFGTQYDIRHAMAEGGLSWSNGVKLLKDHIKTIVLKDFKWEKVKGHWEMVNVPIGEGMVDFNTYFTLLKSYGLKPPVSLHLEYPLGGAEKGRYEINVDQKIVFDAMKKDLAAVRQLWKEA